MAFGTGRSAAKKARRAAKGLKRQQQRVEEVAQIRATRGRVAETQAAVTGAYGLPGIESSGSQVLIGQEAAQFEAYRGQMADFARQEAIIKGHMNRAKSKARAFKTTIGIGAALLTGGAAAAGTAAGKVAAVEAAGGVATNTFLSELGANATAMGLLKGGAATLGTAADTLTPDTNLDPASRFTFRPVGKY